MNSFPFSIQIRPVIVTSVLRSIVAKISSLQRCPANAARDVSRGNTPRRSASLTRHKHPSVNNEPPSSPRRTASCRRNNASTFTSSDRRPAPGSRRANESTSTVRSSRPSNNTHSRDGHEHSIRFHSSPSPPPRLRLRRIGDVSLFLSLAIGVQGPERLPRWKSKVSSTDDSQRQPIRRGKIRMQCGNGQSQ